MEEAYGQGARGKRVGVWVIVLFPGALELTAEGHGVFLELVDAGQQRGGHLVTYLPPTLGSISLYRAA